MDGPICRNTAHVNRRKVWKNCVWWLCTYRLLSSSGLKQSKLICPANVNYLFIYLMSTTSSKRLLNCRLTLVHIALQCIETLTANSNSELVDILNNKILLTQVQFRGRGALCCGFRPPQVNYKFAAYQNCCEYCKQGIFQIVTIITMQDILNI